MNSQKLFILFSIINHVVQCSSCKPQVNISQGIVQGVKLKSKSNRDFSAFIGIPYGEPPIGDLRFSSPVPKKKWTGVYHADSEKLKIQCPQVDNSKVLGQEDCLYLNVFTPRTNFDPSNTNESRSISFTVMVWIHGGAFIVGSNSFDEYGPNFFLDKDIVLVTINYRLGVLGFLSTADLVSPGNFGLKDQVLALKWVQSNIHSFGGDPSKVTIFGESAGGMSVSFHTLSDSSNGLFHQYILQSGNALCSCAYRDKTDFKSDVDEVAKVLDCPVSNSTLTVNCLKNVNFKTLLNASNFYDLRKPELTWIPTNEIASKDAFLTDSPENLLRDNKLKDYPFISGNVADEGLYVTSEYFVNKSSLPINKVFNNSLNLSFKQYGTANKEDQFKNIINDYYFSGFVKKNDTDVKYLKNLTKFVSDSMFLYPDEILINKIAKTAESPFYRFKFGYRGTMNRIYLIFNTKENIGVGHSNDVLYLFNYGPLHNMTQSDEHIVTVMIDLWTSFAIDGKPFSNALKNPHLWQNYKNSESFLQIGNKSDNMDPTVTLEKEFASNRLDFWKKNFPVEL